MIKIILKIGLIVVLPVGFATAQTSKSLPNLASEKARIEKELELEKKKAEEEAQRKFEERKKAAVQKEIEKMKEQAAEAEKAAAAQREAERLKEEAEQAAKAAEAAKAKAEAEAAARAEAESMAAEEATPVEEPSFEEIQFEETETPPEPEAIPNEMADDESVQETDNEVTEEAKVVDAEEIESPQEAIPGKPEPALVTETTQPENAVSEEAQPEEVSSEEELKVEPVAEVPAETSEPTKVTESEEKTPVVARSEEDDDNDDGSEDGTPIASSVCLYPIKKGDTLSEIAESLYEKSRRWKDLAEWNHIDDPNLIRFDKTLVLKENPSRNFSCDGKVVAKSRSKSRVKRGRVTYRVFFKRGVKVFENGEYERAYRVFHRVRKDIPNYLPGWFYELNSLKKLGRNKEYLKLKEELLKERPQLEKLPMFAGD